jgi:hypothetical protein
LAKKHRDASIDKVGRQRRHLVVSLSPTIFDGQIFAFDISAFREAAPEIAQKGRRRAQGEKTNYGCR